MEELEQLKSEWNILKRRVRLGSMRGLSMICNESSSSSSESGISVSVSIKYFVFIFYLD